MNPYHLHILTYTTTMDTNYSSYCNSLLDPAIPPGRHDGEHRCHSCDFRDREDWPIIIHQGSPFNPQCHNAGISVWHESSSRWVLVHRPQLALPITIKDTLPSVNTPMNPTPTQTAKRLLRSAVEAATKTTAGIFRPKDFDGMPTERLPIDEWEVLDDAELGVREEMEVDVRAAPSLLARVINKSIRSEPTGEYLKYALPKFAGSLDSAVEVVCSLPRVVNKSLSSEIARDYMEYALPKVAGSLDGVVDIMWYLPTVASTVVTGAAPVAGRAAEELKRRSGWLGSGEAKF